MFVGLIAAWIAGTPALGQYVEPTLFERTGVFSSRRVSESSGVAVSRRYPGVLWTHNDSGDDPFIYVTDMSGHDRGAFRLQDAAAHDWEDISLGPCPGRRGDCLYVADTGDNTLDRREVRIYVFPEPNPADPESGVGQPVHTLRVRYPDGAHDVEAMAVSPSGEIFLVTKGRQGRVLLFCIPPREVPTDRVVATLIDTLPIVPQRSLLRLVTGAALSPSGRRLVVRTYTELYFFDRLGDGRFRPQGPPCWLGVREPQGEAVDFLDEDTLVLTSETAFRQPGMIARVRCPAPRGS